MTIQFSELDVGGIDPSKREAGTATAASSATILKKGAVLHNVVATSAIIYN